eukprot:TRINITY_DN2783_c0_g1_i1.p1 TRINITY_DN2783_c0_g1~~TRINITY_DN2783_c0_g1_i1.p1  ORF type:complete len:913 (-),score=166.23 TRINITY_DN2783_c0_g1_i1:214-2670(-)
MSSLNSRMRDNLIRHFAEDTSMHPRQRSDAEAEEQFRRRMRKVHEGLDITDAHFDAFLSHFERSFEGLGVSSDDLEAAVQKLARLRLDITGGRLRRKHQMLRRATSDWRRRMLADEAERPRTDGFARRLHADLRKDSRVMHLPMANLEEDEFVKIIMRYWRDGGGVQAALRCGGPPLADVEFLAMKEHVESALACSGWSFEDKETFISLMFEERNNARVLRDLASYAELLAIANPSAESLEQALPEQRCPKAVVALASQLPRALAARPFLRYFGEHSGMPRCAEYFTKVLCDGSVDLDLVSHAHRDLGLTSEHFDAFLEVVSVALAGGSSKSQTSSLVEVVGKVVRCFRPYVLRHAALRHSLAIAREAQEVLHSLSAEKLMDSLYDHCMDDDRIRPFFQGAKLGHLWQAFTNFVYGLMNGTAMSATGLTSLAKRHEKWRISDYHFDSFLELVRAAMRRGSGVISEEAYLLLGRMEVLRPYIVHNIADLGTSEGIDVLDSSEATAFTDDSTAAGSAGAGSSQAFGPTLSWGAAPASSTATQVSGPPLSAVLSAAFALAASSSCLRHLHDACGRPPSPSRARAGCSQRGAEFCLHQLLQGRDAKEVDEVVRRAHEHCFISDVDFSAFLRCFEVASRQLGCDAARTAAFCEAVRAMEAPLTASLAQRRAEAQRALAEQGARERLLQDLGGAAGLERIVARWLELASVDHTMRAFFNSDEGIRPPALRSLAEAVKLLMTKDPDEVRAHGRSLRQVHQHLRIEPFHFSGFMRLLRKALSASGVNMASGDQAVELVERSRSHIVGANMAARSRTSSDAQRQPSH